MTKVGRTVVLLALVATTIGCDRVTKHIAMTSLEDAPSRSFFADLVRLEYAENTGGFLSLGANLPPAVRAVIFEIGNWAYFAWSAPRRDQASLVRLAAHWAEPRVCGRRVELDRSRRARQRGGLLEHRALVLCGLASSTSQMSPLCSEFASW